MKTPKHISEDIIISTIGHREAHNQESKFRTKLFYPVVDRNHRMLQEIRNRFNDSYKDLFLAMAALDPRSFIFS